MVSLCNNPVLCLAILGAGSGVVGSFIQGPSYGEAPHLGLFIVLTGAWFALVVGFGVLVWGRRSLAAVLVAVSATWAAWELAVNLAIKLDQLWLKTADLSDYATSHVSGAAAGALGALITWAGAAAWAPALRTGRAVSRVVSVGAILGVLLAYSSHFDHPAILLVPWQAAVAGMLGLGFKRGSVAKTFVA